MRLLRLWGLFGLLETIGTRREMVKDYIFVNVMLKDIRNDIAVPLVPKQLMSELFL